MADLFTERYRTVTDRPLVIAGPCSAESESQLLETASMLKRCGTDIFRAGIWKPRTKPGSFEGAGDKALPWLASVKQLYGFPVATEVAIPEHVEKALKYGVDILWIGARTSVNPFAVQEIAESLRGVHIPVFVKNPVNPDLELWIGAVERLKRCGIVETGAIHRGFSSFDNGIYRNMPYWSIPLEFRRRIGDVPLICDPSHMGGKRENIASLASFAVKLGFDGLMIESHCNPGKALSDASQQLHPDDLLKILAGLKPLLNDASDDVISGYRKDIDMIDGQILSLLSKRMDISGLIGSYKKDNSISVFQSERYETVIRERIALGESLNLNHDFIIKVMRLIHEESVRIQMEIVQK